MSQVAKATEQYASLPFFSCELKKKKRKERRSLNILKAGGGGPKVLRGREERSSVGRGRKRAGRPLGTQHGAWLIIGVRSNVLNE